MITILRISGTTKKNAFVCNAKYETETTKLSKGSLTFVLAVIGIAVFSCSGLSACNNTSTENEVTVGIVTSASTEKEATVGTVTSASTEKEATVDTVTSASVEKEATVDTVTGASVEKEATVDTVTGASIESKATDVDLSYTYTEESQLVYTLPSPQTDGDISVEKALENRRSRRNYQKRAISANQLSQILWAAYGMTSSGKKTTPSAGALYSIVIYAAVGNVEGIEPGVYRYISEEHKVLRIMEGDVRSELGEAAQRSVVDASATLLISADFEKATESYGEDDLRFVYMEVGHCAQNVYLQAEALGLGTCAIGGFISGYVRQTFEIPANEDPLYLMPVGYYFD